MIRKPFESYKHSWIGFKFFISFHGVCSSRSIVYYARLIVFRRLYSNQERIEIIVNIDVNLIKKISSNI